MKRRVILALVFAFLIAVAMAITHTLAFDAIVIWRHQFWTPIICTIASVPYWMVFAPLLYWGAPDGILTTTAAEWTCAIVMCIFWGFTATYTWDGLKKIRRRTTAIVLTITVVILAALLIFSVRQSTRSRDSRDLQVKRSQMYLDKLAGVLESYHDKFHRYPTTIDELNAGFPNLEFPFKLYDHIDNGLFIRQKLIYRVNETKTGYILLSLGLDGIEGTADDLKPQR